jgi:dolichol-phosphate mannosyltransferase
MRTLIVIPTYNEKDNIVGLVEKILKLNIDAHILIVDDNSPDGTGETADALAGKHPEVHVLHRAGKMGLGTAYIQGFKYALLNGAEYVIEMDADFSHDPDKLPEFLSAMRDYDLVLGSRYKNGISVINWGFRRLLLSKGATYYVKLITGMPVTDATGGFKCFRRSVLEKIDLDSIHSNGYSFQVEMTYRAWRAGFRIGEIQIIFEDRRVGRSKMNNKIIVEALIVVWRLQFEHYLGIIDKVFKHGYKAITSKQFLLFSLVGALGVVINMGVFYLTMNKLGFLYIPASIVAFCVAVNFNFIMNKIWTFEDIETDRYLTKNIKYIVLNIGGLLINICVLVFLVKFAHIRPEPAQLIGIFSGLVFNFFGSKKIVFKK